MPTGTHTLTDVPAKSVLMVKAGFEAEGATVRTVEQMDKNFTVIADFPDDPKDGAQ